MNAKLTRRAFIGLGAAAGITGAFVMSPLFNNTNKTVLDKANIPDETENLAPIPDNNHTSALDYITDTLGLVPATTAAIGEKTQSPLMCASIPIRLKYSLFDRRIVGENATLESVFNRDEELFISAMWPCYEVIASVYTTEAYPDDYILLIGADKLNDANFDIVDILWARDHNCAEMVDACRYDKDTGIAFIPKTIIDDYDNLLPEIMCPLQAQMLCLFDPSQGAPKAKTFINIINEFDSITPRESGYIENMTFDQTLAFQIIDPKDATKISLDDIDVSIESQFFGNHGIENKDILYDEETGILQIAIPAAFVPGIDVIIHQPMVAPEGILTPRKAFAKVKKLSSLRFYGDYYTDEDSSTHSREPASDAANPSYSYIRENELFDELYDAEEDEQKVWSYVGFHTRMTPIDRPSSTSITAPAPQNVDNYGNTWKVNPQALFDYRNEYATELLWYPYAVSITNDIDLVTCTPDELKDNLSKLRYKPRKDPYGEYTLVTWEQIKAHWQWAIQLNPNNPQNPGQIYDGIALLFHGIILPGSKMTGKYFLPVRSNDPNAETTENKLKKFRVNGSDDNLDKKYWQTIKGMDGTNNVMYIPVSCNEIGQSIIRYDWEGGAESIQRTFVRFIEINKTARNPYVVMLLFTNDIAQNRSGQIGQATLKFHLVNETGALELTKKIDQETINSPGIAYENVSFPFNIHIWDEDDDNNEVPLTGSFSGTFTNAAGTTSNKTYTFSSQGICTVNLKANEIAHIDELPAGYLYEITENTPTGWKITSWSKRINTSTGIPSAGIAKVSCTNKAETGFLKLNKNTNI